MGAADRLRRSGSELGILDRKADGRICPVSSAARVGVYQWFLFPAGHAVANAVTAVGLVIVLVSPGPRRWVWQLRAVAFAFLMALSRVYLAAHWLSDVVAGALLRGGLAIGWPAVLQSVRGVRTQVVTPAGMGERWP